MRGKRRISARNKGVDLRSLALTCMQACILGLCLCACGINNIPAYQEIARAKWLDLMYAYSLRDDGTRTFVDVVQGSVPQRQALDDVVTARARAHQAQVNIATEVLTERDAFRQFAQAQEELAAALERLLKVCEADGQIKSEQNFAQSRLQLADDEQRIATARRAYNEAAEQYNGELRTFPGAFWGATLYHNNKPMQTFTADQRSL
jgi:LemA protein